MFCLQLAAVCLPFAVIPQCFAFRAIQSLVSSFSLLTEEDHMGFPVISLYKENRLVLCTKSIPQEHKCQIPLKVSRDKLDLTDGDFIVASPKQTHHTKPRTRLILLTLLDCSSGGILEVIFV
jgi:hypothetical protein